jgi:Na+/H+ antiporter NhaD/arsenite permease-like protein
MNENSHLLDTRRELTNVEEVNQHHEEYSPIVHTDNNNDDDLQNVPISHSSSSKSISRTRTILQKGFRLNKIVIIFVVLLMGFIGFAVVGEEEASKYFAVSQASPATIYLDSTLPSNYVQMSAVPLELPSHTTDDMDDDDDGAVPHHNHPLLQLTVVYLGARNKSDHYVAISNTTLLLQNIHQGNESQTAKYLFETPKQYLTWSKFRLDVYSNTEKPTAIEAEITQHSRLYKLRLPLAFAVLCFIYVLIIFELVHRTVATILGAFMGVAAMAVMNLKPNIHTIVNWVEFHTLILLFGMMIIVAILSSTGFFEWVALKAYKFSKNNVWRLVVILSLIVGVSAAMLDNVTSMLLLTPVIIRLCKVMDMSPVPILVASVVISNIGGCATAVGDPPVTLIVNTPAIKEGGIGFNEILFFMAPGTMIMMVVSLVAIRFIYWKEFSRREQPAVSAEVLQIKQEIEIWKNSAARLSKNVTEERDVRNKLLLRVTELEVKLQETSSGESQFDMGELEKEYRIRNKPLFALSAVVLACVVLMFFLETFISKWIHLSLDNVALIGAMSVIVLSDTHDFDHVLEKVEWSSLLFFATLFIMMGSLEELGLIGFVGDLVTNVILRVDDRYRLPVAITVIIWLSAILSAIVDSIPYTTAMIPVIIAMQDTLKLPLKPLVFSLAYGTGLGGNGTLIGSTANLVVAGLTQKFSPDHSISFLTFARCGVPIMFLTTFTANIYLLMVHCVFKLGMS